MAVVKQCFLCENDPGHQVFLQARDYLVSGKLFSMCQCQHCGLVFTNPRPDHDDLPAYYQSKDYISHASQATTFTESIYMVVKRLMLGRKVRFLKAWLQAGDHLLDIGTGTGEFPVRMKQAGFQAMAIEPEEKAAEMARKKGVEVFPDLKAISPERKNAFAMITMWHVLEHMPDPGEQLNRLKELLRDNGLLVVAVPMIDSHDAAYYKQYWAAFDLPRHLLHFSSSTLVTLLDKHGFQLIKKRSLPFDAFYISLLSEAHKKTLPRPLAWIRAMYTGLVSNIRYWSARRSASSQVFVFGPKFVR